MKPAAANKSRRRWIIVLACLIGFPIVAVASVVGIGAPVLSVMGKTYSIPAASMLPTLEVGDYVWVSDFAYSINQDSGPRRGDIVVFKNPKGVDYLKRIIGLPGERIQYREGRLYINDIMVEREATGTLGRLKKYDEILPNGYRHGILEDSDTKFADNTGLYEVPEDHYFALGDNRDYSNDSRFGEIGPVPRDRIVGRLSIVFWNSKRWEPMWESRP